MQNLLLIQILITLILLVLLWQTFKRWRQGILALAEAGGWVILWVIIGIVFWQPQLATSLANSLGIGRGADLIIYIAILCLLFFIFRLTMRLDKLERNITKLVRQDALKRAERDLNPHE